MISPNQVSRVAGLFGGMGATPDPAIPADPRQQNAMQAAGVTNPLLQQFGQSVAGLFGKADQMASPMQQSNRAMQSLDIKDPNYNLKAAQLLMPIDPERAVAFLKAHEQKQQQQQVQALAERRVQREEDQLGINRLQAQTQAEQLELNREDRDRQAKRQEQQDALTERRVAIQEAELKRLSNASKKAIREEGTVARQAIAQAERLTSLSSRYAQEKPTGGIFGSVESGFVRFFGGEGEVETLRTQYSQLVNSLVNADLPPGVASDGDVMRAREGWPSAYSNTEELSKFMLGMAKLKAIEAEQSLARAKFLESNDGSDAGFMDYWRSEETQEELKEKLTSIYGFEFYLEEDIDFNEENKDGGKG